MICVTVIIILIPHILWTWLFIFVLLVSNLNCCSRCKCAGLHDSRTWNHTSRWVVVYRSFSWRRSFDAHSHVPNWPNHYIKPHAVQCVGRSWHWWLWLLRVRERSQLRWARRIQLEAGLQPRQPLLVPRAQLSDHPTNHRSYHRRWLLCYATSIREGGGAVFTHHTMGFMNHHIQRFIDTTCCQIIFSVWKASSFHAMDGFCKPDMRRCGSCQQQICTTWFVLISRLSHVFCCCSTTLFCWILCTVVSLQHSSGLKDSYLPEIKCILTHLRRMYW